MLFKSHVIQVTCYSSHMLFKSHVIQVTCYLSHMLLSHMILSHMILSHMLFKSHVIQVRCYSSHMIFKSHVRNTGHEGFQFLASRTAVTISLVFSGQVTVWPMVLESLKIS